jgi:hypothetical protein
MRLRDKWADAGSLPRRCECVVKTCLPMIQRTRQNVFSTSDKAKLVSISAFDMDQSYSSRQHDLDDRSAQMLQRNEIALQTYIHSNPSLHQHQLVRCNK